MRGVLGGDKELGAVGVGPGVSHGQKAGFLGEGGREGGRPVGETKAGL